MKKRTTALAAVYGSVLIATLFAGVTVFINAEAIGQDKGATSKFLSISSSSTEVERWWDGSQIVSMLDSKVLVRGNIPLGGTAGNVGYAWMTADLNNVLVLISRMPIDESSHLVPGAGFYTYVLDIKPASPSCEGYNLEVDIPGSLANSAFDKDYDWSVDGKRLKISRVPTADLGDAGVERIVAIELTSILSEEIVTNLCVEVMENPYHGL